MGELFIFKCKDCGHQFEMYHLICEPIHEIRCPECGSKEASRMVAFEHKGALPKMIKKRMKEREKKKKKKEKEKNKQEEELEKQKEKEEQEEE